MTAFRVNGMPELFSMKICDTCGGPIPADHLFALCPKCLFSGALDARIVPSQTQRFAFSNLSARADFFDKYDILEKVAGGGQGEIWKTWDFELRRCIAMKRISENASVSATYRFLAEAQITSQLEHPAILPVFDAGLDPDGRPYYTTQLLSGLTLERVWRQIYSSSPGEWSTNRALELLLRVCDVMGHAHNRGVIHRDLKPANILVGEFGDVRVIDWGSARVLESSLKSFEETFVRLNAPIIETDRNRAIQADLQSSLTTASSGQPLTLFFTAPEIVAGHLAEVGPSTDIYSMGVILYQLLTGTLPYLKPGDELPKADDLKKLILAGPPLSVRSINPRASRDLAAICEKAICEKAMCYKKAGRYLSMQELAGDIRAAMEIRPVGARRPTPLLKLQKWSQRNFPYVLLGGVALVLVSTAVSLAYTFKVERDAAHQAALIHNAELAVRNGRWRDALGFWQAADAAGYRDKVYLGLQEAEAWTVLSEPEKSRAELVRLSRRSDLGAERGAVLLRLGEHELFDVATANQGIQHVREALTAGLDPADTMLARGLLADSTPEALGFFHQVLQYDPYNHGAYVHSVSLELLLGHHQELANHLAVFKILYPDDISPHFIAATEAAMAGDSNGAQKELALLRNQVNSNVWEEANLKCRVEAATANFYDLDTLLRAGSTCRTPLDALRTNPFSAGVMLMPNDFTAATNIFRTAQLPCLQQGLLAAGNGLARLLQPYLGNQALAVQEIESGWHHHPEALMPTLAGMLLENQQPKNRPPLTAILQLQAQLYQMGADSSSMIPQVSRLARYLAVRADFELSAQQSTYSVSVINNCLADIRQAAASPEISPLECQAYFQFALKLGDTDLALQLIDLLEQREPNAQTTRRDRIQVELAMGSYGPALDKIDQLLSQTPINSWALTQRQIALSGLKTLVESNQISFQQKP
jgi:serine/threonine protein kinase